MPALAATHFNPAVKSFYERLIERGKSKKAAVVACMGELLRIIYGVLIHEQPFDPAYITP